MSTTKTRPHLMLAPMVRAGTLPLRILSLHFGADILYHPEEIDYKVVHWQRVENPRLGTIDFVNPATLERKRKSHEKRMRKLKQPIKDLDDEEAVEARIGTWERDRLIFQLGSSSPERAVAATKIVEKDVMGLDLNCGCPKHFSTSGGMGANLLTNPGLLCDILKALVSNFPHLQISCKIRLLDRDDAQKTVDLIKQIEATGIHHIAIHARVKDQRSSQKALWETLEKVIPHVSIPLIINGDVFHPKNIRRFLPTRPYGFMLARGAQFNPSIFYTLRKELDKRFSEVEWPELPDDLPLPPREFVSIPNLIPFYAQLSNKYAQAFENCKWQTKIMLDSLDYDMNPLMESFTKTKTWEELLELAPKFAEQYGKKKQAEESELSVES